MKICPTCELQYPSDQGRCFVDGATLLEMADPRIGATVAGRYLIEEAIGEGGMAVVYRARHTLVDRPVAVKVLNRAVARHPSMKERFRREAKTTAQLTHPNIIEIFDDGQTDDGSPFLVMELLRGSPLADRIESGPMSPGEVAGLGLQMAQGLARAHDFDVIHRDLKPDNIFLHHEGGRTVVKLLDFGIARSLHDTRLTRAGEVFGTPQYMAPERVTSIDAGPAADLYALGVIFFEMLTGRLPFESLEITGYFVQHMQDPPPRPSELAPQCPRRLEELILGLLEKRPEDRPVDAHQVMKELGALLPKEPLAQPAPPPQGLTPRNVAPTLPPTTIERWARRTAIFEEMLGRAFPGGPPHELVGHLEALRSTVRRIHEVRSRGLGEQRKLEALEREAKEARARLGHAVHTLAEDLSQAREAARSALREVEPYITAEREARESYGRAHQRVVALGGYRELSAPEEPMSRALRDTADALDRWGLAYAAFEPARRWIDTKEQEVADVEYQVKMLRAQMERREADHQENRQGLERGVVSAGAEAAEMERSLAERAMRLCDPLRARPELGDLFCRLEDEGA